jgi:DNA-binding winged helix-turn-helix (wHTH) protein/tetratricopeptide (TPR) repeat protein
MSNNNLCYEFGPYQLDPCKRILTREGEGIALTPKATEILVVLVKHAGQLVEKDELLKEVWPDTFVEEANLSQNVFTLRRALGDDRAEPRYIETVARRGYRFLATVRTVAKAESADSSVEATGTVSQSPVVAVLPFLNNTGDPELEYLADGLTGNLINNLSRIAQLRVMSRSVVFRYSHKELEPQDIGRQLGVNAILVGKINAPPSGLTIHVELVHVLTGWQLWGDSFDLERKDLLEIQESITKHTVTALELKLTGEEEIKITARYTENAEAYQSYLEGRYHWSRYTEKGIERAIKHFRRAIEVDPNYALPYAAIVDCYLRLATHYLPPENFTPLSGALVSLFKSEGKRESDPRIKLRFEWDWKGAERELRRANDLRTDYPGPHQWYAAYQYARQLLLSEVGKNQVSGEVLKNIQSAQLHSSTLTPNEESQIFCTIAREQIEVGNYDAGCLILRKYWIPGEWPKLNGLNSHSAADLLLTTGSLASCLSSTGRIQKGQKHAESLLSGSIGIFEHLGANRGTAEAKIELALSYYRQGMFDLAKRMLVQVIEGLHINDNDLRSVASVRLAVVERHAGHVADSLSRLSMVSTIINQSGPLVTGRYHQELAAALKDAAAGENRSHYSEIIQTHFAHAFYEFEAIGHLRYTGVVENNYGYFLLDSGHYDEAEIHLLHAQTLFERLKDDIRRAQVDECLSQLYMTTDRLEQAESVVDRAINSLEANDEEALLAEALTTKGRVLYRLGRQIEGRHTLEGAWRIANRCGDDEGAGRAFPTLIEETYSQTSETERNRLMLLIRELLENTQHAATRARLAEALDRSS